MSQISVIIDCAIDKSNPGKSTCLFVDKIVVSIVRASWVSTKSYHMRPEIIKLKDG